MTTSIQDRLLQARGDGIEEQKEELPDPTIGTTCPLSSSAETATVLASGGGGGGSSNPSYHLLTSQPDQMYPLKDPRVTNGMTTNLHCHGHAPVPQHYAPSLQQQQDHTMPIPGEPTRTTRTRTSFEQMHNEHGFRAQLEGFVKALFGGCGNVIEAASFFVQERTCRWPGQQQQPMPAHSYGAAVAPLPPHPSIPHMAGELYRRGPAAHPSMVVVGGGGGGDGMHPQPPSHYPYPPPPPPPPQHFHHPSGTQQHQHQLVYNQEPAPPLSIAEELRLLSAQQQEQNNKNQQSHADYAPRAAGIPKFLGEDAVYSFDDDNISAISQQTLEEMARRNARAAAGAAGSFSLQQQQQQAHQRQRHSASDYTGMLHPIHRQQQQQQEQPPPPPPTRKARVTGASSRTTTTTKMPLQTPRPPPPPPTTERISRHLRKSSLSSSGSPYDPPSPTRTRSLSISTNSGGGGDQNDDKRQQKQGSSRSSDSGGGGEDDDDSPHDEKSV